MTNPPQDRSPRSRDAARHARMAYKVTSALRSLDAEIHVVPDAESNKLVLGPEYMPSDFVIQYLDLRVRLVLLLDAHLESDLGDEKNLLNARTLLDHWPETTAVALVANDDMLTTVILEPHEASPAIGVPSGGAIGPHVTSLDLPIATAINQYLESRIPSWSRIPERTLDSDETLMSELAIAAADRAVAEEQARGAKILQRVAARKSLDANDAKWAAELVDSVMSGKLRPSSVVSTVEKHLSPES